MSEQLNDLEDVIEFDEESMEPTDDIEIDAPDATAFDANLVDVITDDLCETIGSRSQESYNNLKGMREQWEERIKQGVQWLGLSSATNEQSAVSENACTAVHPLLMENIVKFQAKAIQELWPARGPVRTKIKGLVNPERERTATRVKAHMNYQLTEQVPGFYDMMERNLFRVAFMGVGIRKAAWNTAQKTLDPTCIHIENFYVDPAVTHLNQAEDYVELMEINGRAMSQHVNSGFFRDCGDTDAEESLTPNEITEAIMTAQGFDMDVDRKGFLVGERYTNLDLQGADPLVPDGEYAPYIIHYNVRSGKVYAIRRNWEEGDVNRTKILWHTVDRFIPGFGFYAFGFVHLIGDLAASSTAVLRALVDAGQFANWQAGFKSKAAKFSDSDAPLEFGEFRDVDLNPEELKNAFLPLPAKEPSQVLFALLQFMVAAGQKFADATDEVVQGATNYGPVATTLALLEASQRFYSSIHKRLHHSQHEFFQLLARLNAKNLDAVVRFVAGDDNAFVRNTDYDPNMVDVLPASDPNALSESQRIAMAQVELETAKQFPQHHDMREALRRFYYALGVENIDKLMPDPAANAVTADPMTELQAAMTGKPIKAQLGQNHAAHIAVKEAFMQSPQMQGANDPSTVVGLELLKANISEHKVLMFVAQAMQMAQQGGVSIQNEQVQAMVAQQLVAISAASGQGGGMSAEQQMIELNKEELAIARQRLESQDARENATLAMKQQEIDLKRLTLIAGIQEKNQANQIRSAQILLDNARKIADTAMEPLAERVQEAR